MKRKASHVLVFGAAAAAMLISGCNTGGIAEFFGYTTESSSRKERIRVASEHFQELRNKKQQKDLAANKLLSLHDCFRIAEEHNADLQVQRMEKAAAEKMKWAEILGLLPDLTVSNDFTGRSNQAGSSSRAIVNDGGTYSYSTSTDRNVNNFNVDMAFSLLDFGLAFFNSQQGHDRVLLREKQAQRMRQNLRLDVAKAYFKVAAAQRATSITVDLLQQCKRRAAMIQSLQRRKLITPFRAHEELSRLNDLEKRLSNYIRNNNQACVELSSLLGVYPTENIKVDDSVLDKAPVFDFLPEIELLEQMAILKRPELYEIDIQKHLNILECRKTLLMMVPNVQLYMDFMNSSNSFLYYQSWWELAVRAAYNALKTPQHIARYLAYSDQADIEELRSFAQAIAVMSQVRMATADIKSARERYELNRREYRNFSANLKKAERIKNVRGSLSELELDVLRMTTAETEIERLLAMGAYHISYYRLLNAVGIENMDPATQDALKKELADGKVRAEKELARAKREYEQKVQEAETARIAGILYEDGLAQEKAKKDLEAFEYFARAAKMGNADAMFSLANLYRLGKGVKQNYRAAIRWYIRSANAGNVKAMITIGWEYYRGQFVKQNYAAALKYYTMAAEQGDDRSYYWMGVINYDEGRYDEAMRCFKKIARKGDTDAMVRVGNMYRDGKGQEGKNFKKAFDWFQRAAAKGDASAMNNISMMYAIGEGVVKDQKQADSWFNKYEAAAAKAK
ncbi:MAG: SEL1-like repeat protein [Lentisphaeria bacterium]|nr:SEL1-like repeat protein [Lentisphaeria bacterium]